MNEPYRPSPLPFDTEKRELIFGIALVFCCLFTANCTLYGGLNLGFAIGVVLSIALSFGYLLARGRKITGYSLALLLLCVVIAAGFARSDDGFVKFVLLLFLFVGINLGLSLMAGQNRFSPNGLRSIGDSFFAAFGIGLGKLTPAFQGVVNAFRHSGKLGQNTVAILLGVCIAFPILLVVIPLLISADAAFDGLISLLPSFDLSELLVTIMVGGCLFCLLYTRTTGLIHSEPSPNRSKTESRGLSPLTVGTVLGAVCVVYLAYLLSQLAYLSGGFSGLLPEEYTLAEYARRGFFEMAALSVINLGIITLCLAIVKKDGTVPRILRILCLFLGLASLFLIVAASAKMFLYINSYGLTQLRLLTQIIMLFMAIATVTVTVWLFVPKLPYMKVILLAALVIGAIVIWVDVDRTVAAYNVEAYLSGQLKSVDVYHLGQLGSSAIPHIFRLTQEAQDPNVAQAAKDVLDQTALSQEGFRSWNWAASQALKYLPE